MFLLAAISFIFLSSVSIPVSSRQYGACMSNTDNRDATFECSDGTVIERNKYCNGEYDCYDRSDEHFCQRRTRSSSYSNTPASIRYYCEGSTTPPRSFILCSFGEKCIPEEWKCDGVIDCNISGEDEQNCGSVSELGDSIASGKDKAIEWLSKKTAPESTIRKWGPQVYKIAVAFFLSEPDVILLQNTWKKEIVYELTIQLLSRLSQKGIQNITSSDLASFINAFLVACIDPRDFHGHNLVQELRTRVDEQNSTNPYTLLALCNAGDTITESDVKKLTEIFWSNKHELWADTQAFAVMALSCARNQFDTLIDSDTISELTLELKNRQYRNGTVESLHTTLLVMQALYAAETKEDPDNFDERKALNYILQNQKSDGSFGSLLLTYYALPVLNCRSLVDINSSHCVKLPKDEDTAVFDLMNRSGPKVRVHYSIWIGMDKDIERTLTIRVPTNTSFYGVMEIAAEIDSKYKFEYVVKNRKPYINSISGILDDSESGQFWFPYLQLNKTATILKTSTVDVIPKDNDDIVMWYRRGSWLE